MKCQTVQTRLAEDLNGRFDPEVADHLERCPTCFRLSEDLLELEELSRSLSGEFRVPQTFRDEILAQVGQARRFGLKQQLLTLCGLGAMLLLGWAVYPTFFEPASTSPTRSGAAVIELEELPPDIFAEEAAGYVDVVVGEGSEEEMILRLPSVIRIHREPLQEEFYIDHVSH